MTKRQKLLFRFLTVPSDLTWHELTRVLSGLGFVEIKSKGVTGGSRVKFVNQNGEIINLHKPHPSNIVKRYVIVQIIDKLQL